MSIQRKWEEIPSIVVTLGPLKGEIIVPAVGTYRVKMEATISVTGLPDLNLVINRIQGTSLYLGYRDIQSRFDFVAAGYGSVPQINLHIAEQDKRQPDGDDMDSYTFEQEPVNARRVYGVDDAGLLLGSPTNPMGTTSGFGLPLFDDVQKVLDVNDNPITFNFFYKTVKVAEIDVTYNANGTSLEFKRSL